MRLWQIKIIVFVFLIAVLFLNKDETYNTYYWIISFISYAAFIIDFDQNFFLKFRSNIYSKAMLLLIILGVISLLYAPDFDLSVVHLIVLLFLVLNSYVLFYFVTKYDFTNLIVTAVLVYSMINSSLALHIPFFNFILQTDEEGYGRFVGTELNPNELGIMMVFSVFLSLYTLQKERTFSKLKVGIHYLNIVLAIYAIVLSQSRTSMITCVLLIILFILLNSGSWISSLKVIFPVMITSGILIYFIGWSFIFESITPSLERFGMMLSTVTGEAHEKSTDVRIYYVTEGWSQFTSSPWLGYGIDSFRYYHHQYSHNNYIELLFGLGFLGPLIYYSIHILLAKKLLKLHNGIFIISFLIALFIMDFGTVTYNKKANMLIFVTLICFSNKLISKKSFNNLKAFSKVNNQ